MHLKYELLNQMHLYISIIKPHVLRKFSSHIGVEEGREKGEVGVVKN